MLIESLTAGAVRLGKQQHFSLPSSPMGVYTAIQTTKNQNYNL